MAPLADNLTDRYKLDYEGDFGRHVTLFRFAPGTDPGTARQEITDFINAIRGLYHTSHVFNTLDFSAAGSRLFFPAAWTLIAGSGTVLPGAEFFPRYISFIGRTSLGRRVRLTLFGANVGTTLDYRITGNESAPVAAGWNQLQAVTTVQVGIDGAPITWYSFANVGFNAYYQRKQRRTR
jgi:hypothetical protein